MAKTVDDGTVTEVNEGFYVWIPDTANASATSGKYTTGLPGKFVELTDSNIDNWFKVTDADGKKIGLKDDYMAAPKMNWVIFR